MPLVSFPSRRAPVFLATLAAAALSGAASFPKTAAAQSTTVVPSAFENTEGNSYYGFGNPGGLTFQNLIPVAALTNIPIGSTITGIAYRLDTVLRSDNSIDITFSNYDIRIGGSTVPSLAAGQSFAANQAADTVLARSGALTFAANSFPGGAPPNGSTPNGFGPVINFTAPYTYTGGDLLLTTYTTTPNTGLVWDSNFNGASTGFDYLDASGYSTALSRRRFQNVTPIMQFQFTPVVASAAAPEPGTIALLLTAGVPLVGIVRRRAKRCA